MKRELTLPIDETTAREFRVGDILYLTGQLFTARDEAHRLMLEAHEKGESLPFDPSQMALFHCGPVVRKSDDRWESSPLGRRRASEWSCSRIASSRPSARPS